MTDDSVVAAAKSAPAVALESFMVWQINRLRTIAAHMNSIGEYQLARLFQDLIVLTNDVAAVVDEEGRSRLAVPAAADDPPRHLDDDQEDNPLLLVAAWPEVVSKDVQD